MRDVDSLVTSSHKSFSALPSPLRSLTCGFPSRGREVDERPEPCSFNEFKSFKRNSGALLWLFAKTGCVKLWWFHSLWGILWHYTRRDGTCTQTQTPLLIFLYPKSRESRAEHLRWIICRQIPKKRNRPPQIRGPWRFDLSWNLLEWFILDSFLDASNIFKRKKRLHSWAAEEWCAFTRRQGGLNCRRKLISWLACSISHASDIFWLKLVYDL